jgi:putative peptidoglycan lipid II flippase
MLRDAVCARVFGASAIWSAFVLAFVIPNLSRRLFGEGALSAAFIPAYTRLREKDPVEAGRLASVVVAGLFLVLGLVVVVLELLGLLALKRGWATGDTVLVVQLGMVMLPFMPLVCTTAMLGGMLQTHGRFVPHAASSIILNVMMIGGAASAGWWLGWRLEAVALTLALAVVAAGILQVGWCALTLRGSVVWTTHLAPARREAGALLRRMFPVLIGMGTLQLGTVIDSLLAGYPVVVSPTLPDGSAYPMDEAAAGVLFYGSRLYQFPLGVFGLAIATAVFPTLARAAGDWTLHERPGDAPADFVVTLRRGLRTAMFIGAPATAGLWVVADDLAAAIYFGGRFDAASAERVADVLRFYALAVWAYSLTHVLTRAFFAAGDTRTPMRVGVVTVVGNIALSATLMWPMAERGLALATAIAAGAQTVALLACCHRLMSGAGRGVVDGPTARSLVMSAGGSVAMAASLVGLAVAYPTIADEATTGGVWTGHVLRLAAFVVVGGVVYLAWALVTRAAELRWVVRGRVDG